MKPKTRVRMSEELKQGMRNNGNGAHIDEFGDYVGIVQGLTDYGSKHGPEVDVRWQPSNLRYAYHPKYLVEVNE
jgi:hypothetical protein